MLIFNRHYNKEINVIGKMINNTTKKNDTILVWGNASTFYLAADRKTTGKYVFHQALFLRNYATNSMIQEFYNDLVQKPPKYIIDITQLRDIIPPLDKKLRKQWIPEYPVYENFKELGVIYSFVDKNYTVSKSPKTGWRIYKLKNKIIKMDTLNK